MNHWDSYCVVKGDLADLLPKFKATIKLCKQMGLLNCKLIRIDEDVDYKRFNMSGEWRLTNVRWQPLLDWSIEQDVRISIWVPKLPKQTTATTTVVNGPFERVPLLTPRTYNEEEYCDFGYIVADWSVPRHHRDFIERHPLKPQITGAKLKKLSEQLHLAMVAGQTETNLLMIQEGRDYTFNSQTLEYQLIGEYFKPLYDWAHFHSVHLAIYVPEKHDSSSSGLKLYVPTEEDEDFVAFGYLIAHWDVPLNYHERRHVVKSPRIMGTDSSIITKES